MKVKVSEASGPVLDWMVAKCEGWERGKYMMSPDIRKDAHGHVIGILVPNNREYMWFKPSTNWAQGGPIIEREFICADYIHKGRWLAVKRNADDAYADAGPMIAGPTPLIAAMRCYVASKLGDYVEIPKELE